MSNQASLRIGTRGSPLALAQADETRARLIAAHPQLAAPGGIEICVIKTTGDKVQDRPLSEIGGKGLFTKEIEEALLAGEIDVAVHSMKDVPTWLPDGLVIDCLLPREDPRDVLIATAGTSIATLPRGAVVGSASLRRAAQVKALRPDLSIVPLRGNVETRIAKVQRGDATATLLALAGLKRLHKQNVATAILSVDEILPAVAQGAIGLETRAGDDRVNALLAPLNDRTTQLRVAAERACLAVLDGSCRTPIAAFAELDGRCHAFAGVDRSARRLAGASAGRNRNRIGRRGVGCTDRPQAQGDGWPRLPVLNSSAKFRAWCRPSSAIV